MAEFAAMNRPRPLILGSTNPYSRRLGDALAPRPRGSSGYRLFKCLLDVMPNVTEGDYESAFQRLNVLDHGPLLRSRHLLTGRTIVILGEEVLDFVNHAGISCPIEKILIHPQPVDGILWRVIPHPSGRSTFFNDPVTRTLVGVMLMDLYKGEY